MDTPVPIDDESGDVIVDRLLGGGLVALFEIPEVRQACESAAREMGCPPPTHKILVWLIVQLIGFGQGLSSEWIKNRLVKLAESFAPARKILKRLLIIEASCQDKEKLRLHIIASLSGKLHPSLKQTMEVI